MGNMMGPPSEKKVIQTGLSDPDALRATNGNCKLTVLWSPGQEQLSVSGKVCLGGVWHSFDAGGVRLSEAEWKDMLRANNSGGLPRHMVKRKSAFRKRISISSAQYEHLLRICTSTLKFTANLDANLEGFKPLVVPLVLRKTIALNNQWKVQARVADISLAGHAKICQESVGWYGREIEYFLDLYGDCDIQIEYTGDQSTCVNQFQTLMCYPQIFLNKLPPDFGTEQNFEALPVFDEKTKNQTTNPVATQIPPSKENPTERTGLFRHETVSTSSDLLGDDGNFSTIKEDAESSFGPTAAEATRVPIREPLYNNTDKNMMHTM
eukprot:GHVP01026414.1.p1 GENE.GHVP01026414.1~~GHVP01026414.1.p1  ORF type:complete len:322 (+),score=66.16 GHVP01026414.1:30-995(+)